MKHASKKKNTQRRTVWITVVAIFVVACLLFGAVLLLPFLSSSLEEPMEVMGSQGKQRSALILVHDGEEQLTGAVAVKTDTAACCVQVIGYPKQTEVTCGTTVYTLAQCYETNREQLAECLSAVTGERYGSVWQFSARAVGQLAVWPRGGAVVTLSEAAGELSAGEQTVSALQFSELLERTEWVEPITAQAHMHAEAVALFLKCHLQPQANLHGVFKEVTALCDDRMTIAHYKTMERELSLLAEASAPINAGVPSGKIVGVSPNERYIFTL